jgi:hypothetical protein
MSCMPDDQLNCCVLLPTGVMLRPERCALAFSPRGLSRAWRSSPTTTCLSTAGSVHWHAASSACAAPRTAGGCHSAPAQAALRLTAACLGAGVAWLSARTEVLQVGLSQPLCFSMQLPGIESAGCNACAYCGLGASGTDMQAIWCRLSGLVPYGVLNPLGHDTCVGCTA